ncbi:Uncharacterized protein DAT39_013780 [Clarias magur]|uniref:Uncharacterized protein n=1 Tax=Clarias magur TaxID=1594786 RepID=A0A8J4WY89_CLAMG|nr:Uncharacterized protein DAT39_013780 [Clarias magur]
MCHIHLITLHLQHNTLTSMPLSSICTSQSTELLVGDTNQLQSSIRHDNRSMTKQRRDASMLLLASNRVSGMSLAVHVNYPWHHDSLWVLATPEHLDVLPLPSRKPVLATWTCASMEAINKPLSLGLRQLLQLQRHIQNVHPSL